MPSSFFCKTTAAKVWKSVVSVSAAGHKRGRARGLQKLVFDTNRGQQTGIGRIKINLPGLNSPIDVNKTKQTIQVLGTNSQYNEQIMEVRKSFEREKRVDKPIERGYSGRGFPGRNIGPPDDYNETPFEGFDSTVLMMKSMMCMNSKGRVRKLRAIVVTGNKNGCAGFGQTIGIDTRSVLRKARNLAGQQLLTVPLYEKRTVMHDFFSRYYYTTVFVKKMPAGYGIRAHRVIKSICEAFGIKDILVKVEGVTKNTSNMVRAFFLGLINQRSFQDMANEKQLHLVELEEEYYNYPKLLASPEGKVRTEEELKVSNENLDFTYYIYGGKIKQVKPPKTLAYINTSGYQQHLDLYDYEKNRLQTKIRLAARYGNQRVSDIFPAFKSNAESFKES